MKKILVMLPLVAVLAGCSASMRSGASVYVVREPSVIPAYSWSIAWYGSPFIPLHAWIGLGWMNPFCYYGAYMQYCSLYGVSDFYSEESYGEVSYDYVHVKSSPVVGPKIIKVQPVKAQKKTRSVYAAKSSLDKPARMSPAPRSKGEMGSRDSGLSESRTASSLGSSGRVERGPGSLSRSSSERSEKSSSSGKKK